MPFEDRPDELVLDLVMMVLIAGFWFVFITAGGELVQLVWGNLSPAVHYPVQWLYIAIPTVGVLFILHAVTNLLIGFPREAGAGAAS